MMAHNWLFLRCIMAAAGLVAMTGLTRPQDFDPGLEAGKAEYLAELRQMSWY